MLEKIKRNNTDALYLVVGIYFGLASVYWVGDGGFSEILRWVKVVIISLVFITVCSILTKDGVKKFLPTGYFGVSHYVTFVVLSMPGFFQAGDLSVVIKYFLNISISYVFCWFLWVLSANNKFQYEVNLIFKGVKIIVPFFLIIISAKFLGWPDWYNPFLKGVIPLVDSGFGGTRTSWGAGVALVFPLILSGFLIASYGSFNIAINIILLVTGILSVAIPTSRSAMLAMSIDIVILAMVVPRQKEVKIFFSVVTTIFLIGLALYFAQDLRLSGFDSDGNSVDVSSGRGIGLDYGYELLKNRILFGYGFDNVVIHLSQEESVEIHNSILNHAVSAGVLSAIWFYGSLVLFLINELINSINKKENYIYCMIILNVMICGMFEPNIIWGQMMSSVIFWYAVAKLRAG